MQVNCSLNEGKVRSKRIGTVTLYHLRNCSPSILMSFPLPKFLHAVGDASFDESGNAKYANRKTMSASDRALIGAFREISAMGDRINLPKTIMDRSNLLFKQVSSPWQRSGNVCESNINHYNIYYIDRSAVPP